MPAPLSLDLRTRIVEAYENGEGSFETLAARFSVGRATVERYVKRKRDTGSLAPSRQKPPGPSPKIDSSGLLLLRSLSEQEPDRSNHEFALAYQEHTGVSLSHSSISRAFSSLGISKKKKRSGPRNETAQK